MNTCVFLGNLTRKPELRYVGSNQTPVCSFGLAVNNKPKDKDGNRTTSFFDCEAWGKIAEIMEKHLDKGRQVIINASAIQDIWEKEGQKRSKIKFKVNDFSFVNDGKAASLGIANPNDSLEDTASADPDSPF